MNKANIPELLAPAGNFDCLCAAVQNGADAVYFAGRSFGARSYADNFDDEALKRAIDYCHLRGVRSHITVNTSLENSELDEALSFINFLYNEGADALIVSDLGLATEIKKYFPNFSIHASTQMTIHNSDGVRLAQSVGFDRVVLSRELSLNEIKHISHGTDAELEIFVHGAMCMCYSGQCLLSSVIGGRSGNRGSCAQPCRLPFSSGRGNDGYFLSLKDMCLANHIREISKLNVASLKIEGRMKGPSYVACVTGIYRKYLDNCMDVSIEDYNKLEKIFYRGGFSDGYFTGKKGTKMFDFEKPDNPYLKQTKEIVKVYDRNYTEINDRKISLCLEFSAHKSEYPRLLARLGEFSCEYVYNKLVQPAQNKPLEEETVKSQLSKTGGTPYNFSKIILDIDNDIFLSKSELNEMRRSILEKFEIKYLNLYKKNNNLSIKKDELTKQEYTTGYSCYVSDLKQLEIVLKYNFKRVYVPLNVVLEISEVFSEEKSRIFPHLPEIIKDHEKEKIEKTLDCLYKRGFKNLMIHNVGQLVYANKFDIVLSHRFNVWNNKTAEFLKKFKPVAVTLSPELNLKRISGIKNAVQCEYIVYGRLPVMVTENCIAKNMGNCPCKEDTFFYIRDRKGISFPVKTVKSACRSILYNSVPIYLADKISGLRDLDGVCKQLVFTVENSAECEKICKDYIQRKSIVLPKSYTRGSSFK